MGSKYIGVKFNKLTILRLVKKSSWYSAECKCECGKTCERTFSHVRKGLIKSCGCSNKNKYHGLRSHVLHTTWKGMNTRCNTKSNPSYARYGGRGIKVCKEWKNFMSFYSWAMANGWQKGLQIDRRNNNLGYSPENCRWATIVQQARNKGRSINIRHKGVTRNLGEWAEVTGIEYATLYARLNVYKWPRKRLFSKVRNH